MKESYEVREARWNWYVSQRDWHLERVGLRRGRWHKNQARWYRLRMRGLFTFSEIVARTIGKRLSQISDYIMENNVLLDRLRAKK